MSNIFILLELRNGVGLSGCMPRGDFSHFQTVATDAYQCMFCMNLVSSNVCCICEYVINGINWDVRIN